MSRGTLWVVLRVGIGLVLLALVLSRFDPSQLTVTWGPRLLSGLAVAVGLMLVAQLFSALRWEAILGDPRLTWRYLFRLYLIGNFFSLFLPTSIGGDAVRTTAAARNTANMGEAISSVLLDRVFGVAALALYLAVGVLTSREMLARTLTATQWTLPAWMIAATVAVILVMAAAMASLRSRLHKVQRLAADAWLLMVRFWRAPRVFSVALLLALVVQAIYIAVWTLLAASLGFDLPFALFLFAVPLVSLAAMLPVTFSGLGVREGAWLLLLTPFGLSGADAVTFSLLYFLAFVAVGVVGGITFVMGGTELRTSTPAEQV